MKQKKKHTKDQSPALKIEKIEDIFTTYANHPFSKNKKHLSKIYDKIIENYKRTLDEASDTPGLLNPNSMTESMIAHPKAQTGSNLIKDQEVSIHVLEGLVTLSEGKPYSNIPGFTDIEKARDYRLKGSSRWNPPQYLRFEPLSFWSKPESPSAKLTNDFRAVLKAITSYSLISYVNNKNLTKLIRCDYCQHS